VIGIEEKQMALEAVTLESYREDLVTNGLVIKTSELA